MFLSLSSYLSKVRKMVCSPLGGSYGSRASSAVDSCAGGHFIAYLLIRLTELRSA